MARGTSFPSQKSKKDPMNGNLDTPWVYLLAHGFLVIASLFFIGLSISYFLPANDDLPSDAAEIITSFSSYEQTKKDRGTLFFYAPGDEKPFTVAWLSGYHGKAPDPELLCSGEAFRVVVREIKAEYCIYEIYGEDQRQILGAYDRNAAYRSSQIAASIVLLIFAQLFAAFGVFGLLVGRHPERFPYGFCKLFYKDSAWSASAELHDFVPAKLRHLK